MKQDKHKELFQKSGHDVERIFDGKSKFHKSMANLPIEEKLKIVAVLQRIDYSIKPAVWKKRMMWPYDV